MLFCRTEKIGWKWVAIASVASRRPSDTGCGSAGSGPDLFTTRWSCMCASEAHRHAIARPERIANELTITKHCRGRPGSRTASFWRSSVRLSTHRGASAPVGRAPHPWHGRCTRVPCAALIPDRFRRTLGVRWARWTTRRRAPILWSALLVAIVAAPIAARLPLRGDMSYLLPPQTLSVRDLHTLEARAQVFGTIIVAIESDDAARRSAAARLVRDRLAALPAGAVIGVSARQRGEGSLRLGTPPPAGADRGADRDSRRAGGAQGAAQSAVRVAGRRRGRRGGRTVRRWAIACVTCKQQLDAAKAGAEHPAPLVSKDGRLQIVVVRTRFPAGEVSRNAPVLRRGRARGRRGAPRGRRRRCASGSRATSSTPRRSSGRCWAACCERPCSRS